MCAHVSEGGGEAGVGVNGGVSRFSLVVWSVKQQMMLLITMTCCCCCVVEAWGAE